MYNKFIVLLLFVLFSGTLSSQTNYTSHYSRFGLGKINKVSQANNIGMGYTGIAYRDKYHTNSLNVASLTSMDTMSFIFSVGLKGGLTYTQAGDATENHYFANINYFSVAFPITKWWFSSIGIRPYSSMGYNIENTSNVTDDNGNVITQTTQTFTGQGDVSQIYFGQAFKYKNVSFGFNASYLFGSLDKTTKLAFPPDAGAYNMFSESRTVINDFYFDFGVQYQTQISTNTKMFVGLTYKMQKNIMSQTELYLDKYFATTSVDTIFNGTIDNSGIVLPMGIGIGLGFEFNEKVLLFGDFTYTDWKNAKLSDNAGSLENSLLLNLGLQYTPKKLSLRYWDRINYRIGGYYEKSYIVINNEQLKNIGITFGLGFPLKKTGTMFNFGFDLGQYGTTANGLIKESYVGAHISLSLFDKWFYKRKFD